MNVKLRVLSAGVLFFIGHSAMAQKVKKDTTSTKEIDEVVVVGYSKVNRSTFVGSASNVDVGSIDRKSVSTVSQALAGEVSGVRVINPSGQPGREATIRIRGFGSVNGNRDPLYVVDGAPYSGNVSAINPDDIESMVVLKDATATSVYGARGANGVIVINTKKGRAGKSVIQIESKIGINTNLLPRYEVIGSPEEYIGLSWEALYNQGKFNGNADPVKYANDRLFSASGINASYNMWKATAAQLIDPVTKQVRPGIERKYNPESWEKAAFSPGVRTEQNFSISGGEAKTRYYTNIGYLKDEGYSINSQYERYTGRLNVTHQAKPWLKGEFNLGYAYSKTKNGGQTSDSGSIFWFVDNIPSIYPLYLRDANGNMVPNPYYGGNVFDYGQGRGFGALTNSISDATINKVGNVRHEINANVFLEAKITDFLKFETRFSGQYYNESANGLYSPFYGSSASQGGSISKVKREMVSWTFLQLLRFNKRWGNHGVEAFAAHESTSYNWQYLSGYRTGLISPDIPEFNNATTQQAGYSYTLDYALESYFGQVSYDYDNKYLASFTVRRDGSSRFLKNKWGNFASAGIGWVVSRENFMKNVSFLPYLKLRGSYGTTGDQGGVGYYPGYNVYDPGNMMGSIAAVFNRNGYPDLTWETHNKSQLGLDFSLFKNRVIEGTIDIYKNKITDLIFDSRLAPSTGNAIEKVNDGQMTNKGLEFNLVGHIVRKKDFFVDLSINGALERNKLNKMPIDRATGLPKVIDLAESGYGRAVGRSIYDYYMRDWAGVNPDTGAAKWFVNYVDANNNGKFDAGEQISSLYDYMQSNPNAKISEGTTEVYSQATQRFVGKSVIPDISGGVNLYAGYKGFTLSVQMLYSFGGYGYDSAYAGLMHNGQIGGNNWSTDIRNRWQKPGDITDVPRITSNRTGDTNYISQSTRFLTKKDYLALNNVTIGYSVPKSMLEGLGLDALQLTLSGDNLWLGSKRRGFNPSTSETGATSIYTYSPLSTFTFGVKVNF
ncbi:SusC/RagA family TonB-linked outer membrane protein [Elizabethkingia anophelis]|uniref:SusC/RagA family TonB-linked outer membrane protein n=1 Tax=Elizabethkingia anophelis TaxID=1117645 RepID=UPI000442B0CC|nr:SusC/RagA family TonB-linked outer membrane protein [Elizabethkingia anophelis]MCT4204734.1 SusC/RagA family TonB-linked outer membrane protein [Elizabethkingia anophelis]MCT4208248.1 SusC/RagA family TonB-linked outer membrane protein [Elizabethkingia anophelis]MDV4101629.1 SusC/RagA family TonB-linked outer membrane protein [Elizabethkingia anophelis]CDN74539.1 TonB-linked outer membrane protein, SusC/RagA family [Elizabethkingia anophelis]CDN78357.1 TonB-linked outer membrane protein, Su